MDSNENFGWSFDLNGEMEYELLPEGDYPFVVESYERGHYAGDPSRSLPECLTADVSCRVTKEDGDTVSVKQKFFLNKSNVNKLKAFFICIGMIQPKQKEAVNLDFDRAIGYSGVCHIAPRQGKSGGVFNSIARFLPPDTVPAPAPAAAPALASATAATQVAPW